MCVLHSCADCFEVQDVSGSKLSDSPGQGKALKAASGRWRRRRLCRRRGASWVPPRGDAAEVRHCPVPVRCPGWGSVSRSATPGPLVSRQALVYVGFEPVARLSVRTVRCKNSAMVVHFIIICRCSGPIFGDICLAASQSYQMLHRATIMHMGHVRLDCQEFVT